MSLVDMLSPRKRTLNDFLKKLAGEDTNFRHYKRLVTDKAEDVAGNTALHLAAWTANLAAVEWAIELQADVNAKNQKGETPLDCVVTYKSSHKDCPEIVRRLLPMTEDRSESLKKAAYTGNPGLILLLCGEEGDDPIQIFARTIRDQLMGLLRSNGMTQDDLMRTYADQVSRRKELEEKLAYEKQLEEETKAEIAKHQSINAQLGEEMMEKGEKLAMQAQEHHKKVTERVREIEENAAAIHEKEEVLELSRSQRRKLEMRRRASLSATATLESSVSSRSKKVAELEKERQQLDKQIEELKKTNTAKRELLQQGQEQK